MAKAPNVPWTREHYLIALNLYGKLPFSHFDRKKAVIKEVAEKMGRSAGSLAMKLGNLASLDPVHKARGVKGLPNATRMDKAMWDEFQKQRATLAIQSEQMLHDLFTSDPAKEVDFLSRDKVRVVTPTGPTEIIAPVKVRRGQQFFRQSVINSYNVRCCISGINVPRLLVASHIKSWRFCSNEERLNPRNGLCLSSLHDAAFDSGLITLDEKLNVLVSKRLRDFLPQPSLEQNFLPFEGKRIRLPEKLAEPDENFLNHHREKIFQS
jgi:predicted restriction endonuclease